MSWTPLTSAVAGGYEEIAKFLLERGATPRSVDANGWTLLHHAAESGKRELFITLLDLGLEPMTGDRFGNTPLHIAAKNGHSPIVDLLHDRWKRLLNYSVDFPTESGRTALHSAILSSSLPMVKLLLSPGFEADIKATDGAGRTCLMYASYQKNPDVFKYIMDRVSPDEVTRQDCMGGTPLH